MPTLGSYGEDRIAVRLAVAGAQVHLHFSLLYFDMLPIPSNIQLVLWSHSAPGANHDPANQERWDMFEHTHPTIPCIRLVKATHDDTQFTTFSEDHPSNTPATVATNWVRIPGNSDALVLRILETWEHYHCTGRFAVDQSFMQKHRERLASFRCWYPAYT